jgi:hypothetical protein
LTGRSNKITNPLMKLFNVRKRSPSMPTAPAKMFSVVRSIPAVWG